MEERKSKWITEEEERRGEGGRSCYKVSNLKLLP